MTRRFGDVAPIEGLDAAFAAGTVTAVTGPSGSGKTTLLHLLAGLDLPDEGDVLVDGVSLTSLDRAGRAELRRRSVAFVGQTVGLVPFLGARENAEIALELRGLPTGRGGRGDRRGRPGRARRATGVRALGRPARACGARPCTRLEAARDHRRRADVPARCGQLARARHPARRGCAELRNDRHLRDPRPAADRAGRRRALARIAARWRRSATRSR